VPAARLASPAYADSLRGLISPAAALPWRALGDTSLAAPGRAGAGHTSHLSVVDADGGAVALTSTINLGFGSGLVAPGTGVVLNDEMDDFALAPGVPNAFGPAKRPLSSMTPTVLTRDGEVALVLGSPGGSRIITAVLQTLVNVVDFGLPLARAVGAPRLHQQWQPPETDAEPLALSPETAALLRARGHAFRPREAVGNVQAIRVDPATGRREGASDPRGAGAAAGY
jgi:gamma-glutamyltranspeptidase/glutathione hydrolase